METDGGSPIVVLVEWQAPSLEPVEARRIAEASLARYREFDGFVDGRFFGDFESGAHFYVLTWRDRAAMDAYAASEAMLAVRSLASRYVEGRPSRRICLDYTPHA